MYFIGLYHCWVVCTSAELAAGDYRQSVGPYSSRETAELAAENANRLLR